MEKLHFFCSKIPEHLKRIQEMVLEGEMLEWGGEGSVKETEGAEPSSSSPWSWGTWAPLPLHETPVAVQQGECSQAVLLIFTLDAWLNFPRSTGMTSPHPDFGEQSLPPPLAKILGLGFLLLAEKRPSAHLTPPFRGVMLYVVFLLPMFTFSLRNASGFEL